MAFVPEGKPLMAAFADAARRSRNKGEMQGYFAGQNHLSKAPSIYSAAGGCLL
jgi:hypothetical protein